MADRIRSAIHRAVFTQAADPEEAAPRQEAACVGVRSVELVAAALREGLDITIERQKEAKRLALILYEIL